MQSSSRTALLSASEGSNGVAPHSAFDLRTQVMVAAKPCEQPEIEQSCVIWQVVNWLNARLGKQSANARSGLKGRPRRSLICRSLLSGSTFQKAAPVPYLPEDRNRRQAPAAPAAA